MKKSKEEIIFFVLIAFAITLSLISVEFLVSLIVLTAALFLIAFSLKSKYKLLLQTFAALIFFHFLLFPWLYIVLLKFDKNAFRIDKEIETNEVIQFEKEINNRYKPNDLQINQSIINTLLNSDDNSLDSTLELLNNNNLLFLDSFIIHKTAFDKWLGRPSGGFATIAICNKQGNNIANIIGKKESLNFPKEVSIRDYLKNYNEKLEQEFSEYNNKDTKINNKDIWSYRRILAYSVNIFDSGNIKPISKISNFLFFIHKLIVVVLIFGFIGSALMNIMIKKE